MSLPLLDENNQNLPADQRIYNLLFDSANSNGNFAKLMGTEGLNFDQLLSK